MALFKNIRLVFIFILLLVVPSLVMAISWTAMPGLGSGQYNSVAVEDFNKDGYKDIAGVKGDTASVWQQSLRWVCPASLYSWSFTGTDNGPSFSATYNAIAAGDIGSGPGNNPNLKPDGMPDTVVATTGGIYIFYGNSLDTWNSTPPVKGSNTGYGRMSGVGTDSNTPADNWTVQCTTPRAVTTNLPQSTSNGGTLNTATLPYPNLMNSGDTYTFTFSNLSTASGVNPKKAFIVTKEELPVGEGRVDQSFTTLDSKISISPANWSSTSSILPDETIDLTINSVTPAAFSVNDSTPLLGEHSDATADVAYSDVIGGTGLSFTISEDKNAGFIAGDKFTFTTYDVSDNLITGSATDVVSLRLADVDNDGELEIVAGTSNGIIVYNFTGGLWGTLDTGSTLPTTGEWRGIAVRDMDRDGNMDIVAASTTAGFIKAWYGDGAGLWTVADDLTTSSAIYWSLDVEDVSRDGIYDIIAGVGDSGIEVWLGDSNGDFSQGRKPTGTDRYYDVKIADINYDYKPDIIGAQWGGGIPVWLGDGTGEWWLSETEPIETGDYRAIAVTDMNNDGLPDVAGASYGGGVDVFLQSRVVDPSINWAKSSFPTASGDFQGTAVGDFNRDGNQDIVVAGNASGVRVFYGNGETEVQSSSYIYNGYTGTGNGTIEILGTDDTKTNTEDWEVTCVTGGANPVFEVSRNGVSEAALYSLPGTYTHSGTGVSFVIYPGTTNFAVNDAFTFRTIEGGITSSGIYYGLVTADFNNDGILDVAAASNGGGGIDIWYGNGEGEWDSVPPADGSWDGNAESENIGSGNYYYLAAGDINSDGKLDIVAGSDATGVHVFLNGWDGSTTGWTHNASPPQDPVSTGSYSGVALSDFDNDGNLDIAAASRGGDGVMVWLGNGDGSFNATNTGPDFASSVILTDEYGMGRTMTYYYDGIAAADFDRDGNMDIVAGNLGNFGVQVFYGDGDKLRHGHVTWNLSNVTPPVPSCGSSGNIYVQDLAASSYGQSYYGEYGSFGKDIYISGTKVRVGVATSDYVTGDSDVTLTAHQPTEDEPWDFIDSCSGGGISIDFPSSGCSNGLILRGTSYSYDPQDLLYFSTYNPGVTTSGQYYGVATEDFNKDGYPDVVAANKNNGGIQVWLNGGSKSFYRVPESSESISSVWTSTTDPVVNGNYKGVAVVDFNKDGNMDIVGAHDFTGGTGAEVWLNSVDLIPPTVVPESLSPESDATDVSTGASISAQFSEDIDILTLRNNDTTGTFSPSSDSTIMVYGSKSGYHSGVINYDSTTFTVTFYPDAPFTTTEIVTVTFSSKIADSAGNHLDGNGDGTGSDTPSDYFLWSFTVVDTVKPLPPTAVTGTPGEGKAILSWTAPVKNEDNSTLTDLAGFNVYRGNVSGGPYFKINSTAVSSSVTTYTNSPLTNGATYYYVITAVDQYGNESVNSTPQVSVTPALDTVKPSPPESFAAVAGNQKVTLTWTAPATNDDDNDDVVDDADDVSTLTDLAGYWVYRGTAPGVYGSGPINSVLIPAGTVEYIDTTATNGTTYYYAVTAEDSSISTNESGYSTEGSAAPYNDITAPRAPSSVTATGGAAEITLSWTAPTENEDSSAISEFNSYKIYRHLASFTDVTDTGVTLIATITDYSVTSWKDTASNGLVIDTTYYYRVTSTDTNGNESATPSNQVSAAPLNPVGALGLYSSDYTIPADGVAQATITAIAQSPLGYPVADGTTINFSVSCSASECGTLSAFSATTSGGQVSVTITSSTILTNSVTITASSGTVSGSTTIAFNPGPPSSITISTTPSTIVANGADTTTVKAIVKDSGGNLVKDGLYVTFTTTRGTFPNGTTTSDPVSTSNGEASVVLTAGIASGTATITTTVGVVTANYTGLTLTADTAAPTVLSVSPTDSNTNVYIGTNISAVFSENIKTSTLTAVTFTVSGSVSGAVSGVITYDSSAKAVTFDPVTDFSNGETITVTLTTGITDLVGNAMASDYVWSFTAVKPISQRTPAVVTVSADPVDVPVSVTADDRFSSTTITATVVDQIDNPVADGYSVVFTTTKGSFSQTDGSVQTMTVSTSGGLATVKLYSTDVYTRTYGVTVTATCEGINGFTTINFKPGSAEDVTFTASPAAIASDGLSTSSITIKVRDAIAGGRSTALAATVLTDNTRSWTVNAFKGMKLNPDTTQSTTYTIASNTATTITVTASDMTTVASSGKTYKVSATGTSTGITSTVLTDSTASWTVDALIGLNLNPNTSQGQVFEITDNDATTITVKTNGLNTVATAGNTYEIAGDYVKDGLSVTFTTDKGTFLNGTQTSDPTTTSSGIATVAIKSSTTSGDVPVITAILGRLEQEAKPVTFSSSGASVGVPAQLTLSSSAASIAADGTTTATITAKVLDQYGNPVSDGLTVNFTKSSLEGAFSSSSSTTSGGNASVTLTSGIVLTNSVTITATCEGKSNTTTIAFKPGPPDSANITFSASPAAIPADGISTSTITATVKDSGGNSVKDGLYVTFTTTIGTFANGTTTSDPVATSGGAATVSLESGATGTPTITATVGSATNSGTPLTITSVPAQITASASPSTIAADGATTSAITAYVDCSNDSVNNCAIGNGVVINFTTTSGTLSASSAAIAGGAGQATVDLTSTSSNGSATVTATWTNGTTTVSNTTTVTFSSGLPSTVTVTSDRTKVAADDTQTTTISATVKDSAGNNVNDGVTVNFAITSGTGTISAASATTTGGIASVTLRSNTKGDVTVTATAATGTGSGTATVTFVEPPAQIVVYSSDLTIPADGTSQATITALVLDQYGYLVADGLAVTFSATAGTLSAATGTTSSGMASATITATTAFTNSVTITATCEGLSGSTAIEFNPGPPNTIEISASPTTIYSNGSDTSTITAILKDSGGNLVKDGLYVTLSTTLGTFSSGTQVSNPIETSGGQVSAVLAAGVTSGTATITATIGSVSASYAGLTLTVDNIIPTVTSVSPADGNADVSVSTDISAIFSESIMESTLNSSSITVTGSVSGAISGVITYDSSVKEVTFNPLIDFANSETVTVILKTTITDLAGNGLGSDYTWSFTTPAPPASEAAPAAPTGLAASAGDQSVSLSWTANTETDLQGYNVYRSTTSGSGYAVVNSTVLTSASYTDTGLTNGTTYYYVITAVDTASLESSYSSEVSDMPYSPGDADRDGVVNGDDLIIFGSAFGSQTGDANWNANVDFDDNGVIDAGDLVILGRYFGRGETW